jgi:hypothetical protein
VIIYLNIISRVVFVMETYCILPEMRTDYSVIYLYKFCYGLDDRSLIPGWGKVFLVCITSTPVLGPTQFPVQLVPGAVFPGGVGGLSESVMKLTTHLHLIPRVELYLHSLIRLLGVLIKHGDNFTYT